MVKSHTLLCCTTLLLAPAVPLVAQAPFTDNSEDATALQHDTKFSFKAAGVLSGVALFTALLKAYDNSIGTSSHSTLAVEAPGASRVPQRGASQNGSNDDDSNIFGNNDDEGIGGTEGSTLAVVTPQVATVPEPGTLVLVATALFGLAGARRRTEA